MGHDLALQRFGVGGAAGLIDIESVGIDTDRHDSAPKFP